MSLIAFRTHIRTYCRNVGKLQKTLAQEMGLNYSVLSNKLNGTSNAYLTQPEIKKIIGILVAWEALTRRSEVLALLDTMDMKLSSFSEDEWHNLPLTKLENDIASVVLRTPSAAKADPPIALPVPMTPLIGREQEIADVRQLLLDSKARLVTLLGPGGVGKTRLALAVAGTSRSAFDDGVFFVDLAALRDPTLVTPTIAHALAVKESARESLHNALMAAMGDKHMLLVLDNFEQVVAAADVVASLLNVAPNLAILVTSRIALRLRGEHSYNVSPLVLPALSTDATPAQALAAATASPAVKLFVERAASVRSHFALTAENAAAIGELCVRLDGLPLAIELMTAHLRVFSPQTLLARLDTQTSRHAIIPMLERGASDLPTRQQTIRQSLDWSYDLLNEHEKTLFAALSVFSGGWSLDAAETICTIPGTDTLSVLSGLESLVEKSMVSSRNESTTEPRFDLLQIIAEYSLEKLLASDAEPMLRTRHAAYYLNMAETIEPELRGSDQTSGLARLDQEHNNIRAALGWLLTLGESAPQAIEQAGRMGAALYRFWWLQGYFSEGVRWVEAILAHAPALPQPVQAKLLHGLGQLLWDQGDSAGAIRAYEKSLALWRTLDDTAGIAGVLDGLGYTLSRSGDPAKALEYHRSSEALWRVMGDARGVAVSRYNQALALQQQGDYSGAKRAFTESTSFFLDLDDVWGVEVSLIRLINMRESIPEQTRVQHLYEKNLATGRRYNNERGMGLCLRGLGRLADSDGDHKGAIDLYRQSLTLFQNMGDKRAIAHTAYGLGWAAFFAEEYAQAETAFNESLRLYDGLHDQIPSALTLLGLALIAVEHGNYTQAAYLFGVAEGRLGGLGFAVPPRLVASYRNAVECTQAALSEALYQQTWKAGYGAILAR